MGAIVPRILSPLGLLTKNAFEGDPLWLESWQSRNASLSQVLSPPQRIFRRFPWVWALQTDVRMKVAPQKSRDVPAPTLALRVTVEKGRGTPKTTCCVVD